MRHIHTAHIEPFFGRNTQSSSLPDGIVHDPVMAAEHVTLGIYYISRREGDVLKTWKKHMEETGKQPDRFFGNLPYNIAATIIADTIENNINFGLEGGTEETARMGAIFAGVDDDVRGFNKGYQTVSGERGVTLSGGQKQRISIARAYVKNAPILILDDSVSAVDTKTEETILHNITNERKGKTTLVVASRISTVSQLDKIIVLNDGEVEAFDTPHNLLKISPTYQKMVKLQELESEVEGGNS